MTDRTTEGMSAIDCLRTCATWAGHAQATVTFNSEQAAVLLAEIERLREIESCGDLLRIAPEPAVDRKIAARDLHYTLIESYGLKDDPVSNHIVRTGLERLAGFSREPGAKYAVGDQVELHHPSSLVPRTGWVIVALPPTGVYTLRHPNGSLIGVARHDFTVVPHG